VNAHSFIDQLYPYVYQKVRKRSLKRFIMRKADPALQNRRRAEILAAAEQCFLKRGFHQSSMQNIAAAAGLSMGLLYRYFTNKEAIIETAAHVDREAALAAIIALPETGDVITEWTSLIITMAIEASAPDYATLTHEIIAEASRSPKLLATLQANDQALALAVAAKLDRQHAAGAITTTEKSSVTAQLLLMFFDGLIARRFIAPQPSNEIDTTIIQRMVRAILIARSIPRIRN
jgi:TetR/AcrR family transcriptional regulator, repressor for uid operon